MFIESIEALRSLYGAPRGRAREKQLDRFETHSGNFVRHSPFVVIATYDRRGRLDASPRGGAAGFVQVLGPKVLVIPDAKGNNRIDSLINIIETRPPGGAVSDPRCGRDPEGERQRPGHHRP